MKTNHLIPLLLALLTLGACVSPQDEATDCQECNEQQIVIKLASDNAPATRAGRPLTSNQPNQDVDRVMLIVCNKNDNKIVYTKLLTDWMTTSDIYIDQNDRRGREDVVKLEGEELLPVGNYKVYAIAYTYKGENNGKNTQYTVKGKADDGTDPDMNLNDYCEGLKNFEDGSKFTDNFTLTDAPGEELFAGSQEFTANAAGFATEVVLNRQVAGVYLYVKDIPYYDNLAQLRLMPATDNDGLVLGRFANEDIAENGEGQNELYVMNGTTPATPVKPLCEINLTDWFTDGKITQEGNLISTEGWKQPDSYPKDKYTFQEGSFFGGSFVIPFAASATESTNSLEIQLVSNTTENGDKIEKRWSVKLPQKDLTAQSGKIWHWDANTEEFLDPTIMPAPVTETVTNYSLLRNHLYCIGNKFTDTGEDLPQSLYTKQDILLTVIAEWDIIYDMVLEPGSEQDQSLTRERVSQSGKSI